MVLLNTVGATSFFFLFFFPFPPLLEGWEALTANQNAQGRLLIAQWDSIELSSGLVRAKTDRERKRQQ